MNTTPIHILKSLNDHLCLTTMYYSGIELLHFFKTIREFFDLARQMLVKSFICCLPDVRQTLAKLLAKMFAHQRVGVSA